MATRADRAFELIERWRAAERQVRTRAAELQVAEAEAAARAREMGRLLLPRDAEPGERFNIWIGDRLYVLSWCDEGRRRLELRSREYQDGGPAPAVADGLEPGDPAEIIAALERADGDAGAAEVVAAAHAAEPPDDVGAALEAAAREESAEAREARLTKIAAKRAAFRAGATAAATPAHVAGNGGGGRSYVGAALERAITESPARPPEADSVTCPHCRGTGWTAHANGSAACTHCHGTGRLALTPAAAPSPEPDGEPDGEPPAIEDLEADPAAAAAGAGRCS